MRLCDSILQGHDFVISRRHFWSDSATVVNWIKSDHRRYKPFVAHRVSEILESTNTSEWHWISTKINAADEATRAKFPLKYNPDGGWKNGPSVLREPSESWPSGDVSSTEQTGEELKAKLLLATVEACSVIDFSRFSSYLKLKRNVGWVCRFLHNKFHSSIVRAGELSVEELREAEFIICRLVQREVYSKEVLELSSFLQCWMIKEFFE